MLTLLVAFGATLVASAQTAHYTAPVATATAANAAAMRDLLSDLPASDAVAYIEVKRILDEALPSVLASAPDHLAKINAEIAKLRQETGIDARSFDRVAIGMKFISKGGSAVTVEPVVMARGTFEAGALIAAARLASKGKYREEKYKDKTIYIFSSPGKGMALPASGKIINEIAVAVFDSNTLVIGETARVQETIESTANASAHPSSELIGMATRKPEAVLGFGGIVPAGVVNSMTSDNDEIGKTVASITHAFGSVSFNARGMELAVAARTKTSDDAATLRETLLFLKQLGGGMLEKLPDDQKSLANNALQSLQITSTGNETQLSLTVAQSDYGTIINIFNKPKKVETAAPAAAKPASR